MSISFINRHPFATTVDVLAAEHALHLKEQERRIMNNSLMRPLKKWSLEEINEFKQVSSTVLTLYFATPRQVKGYVLTPVQYFLMHFKAQQQPILDFFCREYPRELCHAAKGKCLSQGSPLVDLIATSLKNDGSLLEYAPNLAEIFARTVLPMGLTFQEGVDFYFETRFVKSFKLLMPAQEVPFVPLSIPLNSNDGVLSLPGLSTEQGQKRSASPEVIEVQPPLQRARIDTRESHNPNFLQPTYSTASSLEPSTMSSVEPLQRSTFLPGMQDNRSRVQGVQPDILIELIPLVRRYVKCFLPKFNRGTAIELIQYALRCQCKKIFEERVEGKLNLFCELIVIADSVEDKWELLYELKRFGEENLFIFLQGNGKIRATGLFGFLRCLLTHQYRSLPTDNDYKFLIKLSLQYPILFGLLWGDYQQIPNVPPNKAQTSMIKRVEEFEYMLTVLMAVASKCANPGFNGTEQIFNRPQEFRIMSITTQAKLQQLEAFVKEEGNQTVLGLVQSLGL